jgi:hypothetical protein
MDKWVEYQREMTVDDGGGGVASRQWTTLFSFFASEVQSKFASSDINKNSGKDVLKKRYSYVTRWNDIIQPEGRFLVEGKALKIDYVIELSGKKNYIEIGCSSGEW